MSVTNILSWESTNGTKYAILLVKDDEKHHREVDYMKLELCEYDSQENKWKTKEVLDSIDEIESFGIPPGYSP